MRNSLTLFLSFGLGAVLWSCAPAAESSTPTEVTDSAGVTIVENHEPRWPAGEGWSVAETARVTLGVLSGPEEYQLVGVTSAARQSDGDLVLVDRAARTVRLYDPEGTYLRTLGGPGSGPGEFEDPGTVLVTNGDSVAVWDNRLFRITWFDGEGELARVQSIDLGAIAKAVEPPLYPGRVEPLRDGRLLVRLVEKVVIKGGSGAKTSSSNSSRARTGALRVSADYSVIDTLQFFGDTEHVTVEAPWGPVEIAPPLAETTGLAHHGSPTRVCIGDQEGPEVVCVGPDGNRSLIRWRSEPRAPVRQEIETWREETLRSFGEKLAESDIVMMMDQVPVPETRPPYTRILLDHPGNLWVEIGPARGDASAGMDHLVFDPGGFLLGQVTLPAVEVLEIGRDYVLGLFRDELEVEYVQLYDLIKPSL